MFILHCWRRGVKAWELIKWRNLSLQPHCAPQHAHRKHPCAHTHTHSHTLSALLSIYIAYEFWHAALDGWQKAQSFVCRQLFHTSRTWPQQACLEVQASKTTHTCTHTPAWGFFVHPNFLSSLLTLYGFYFHVQTHLNSQQWFKTFLPYKRLKCLCFYLFANLNGFYTHC